jgi:hypothetical protein
MLMPPESKRAHAERLHLWHVQDLDRATLGRELARDLCHPLRVQVVGCPVRERAAELDPLGNLGGAIDDVLRRRVLPHQDHLRHAAQHRLGVAHASVVGVGPVGALHGADHGRGEAMLVLAVPQPEGHALDAVSLQAPGGRRGNATGPPRALPTAHAVDQQEPLGGDGTSLDQRGVVLGDVELAPVDGPADGPAGGGIEVGEVAAELPVFLVDGYRQDIGLDGGGIAGLSTEAHAPLLLETIFEAGADRGRLVRSIEYRPTRGGYPCSDAAAARASLMAASASARRCSGTLVRPAPVSESDSASDTSALVASSAAAA